MNHLRSQRLGPRSLPLLLGVVALLGSTAGCVSSVNEPQTRRIPGTDAGQQPGSDAGAQHGEDLGGRPDLGPVGAKVLSWTRHQRVLVLNYDPVDEAADGQLIRARRGWNDPHMLADQYAQDMEEASGGSVTYEQVHWLDLDEYPVKRDGFRYDDTTYQACLDDGARCYQPDLVDYPAMIERHDLCGRVERGEIDEIWAFGGPYMGFYESTMAGDGAFWVNSPPVPEVGCSRRFIIMGFNYERGTGYTLHDFGHRLESIMKEVFSTWPAEAGPDPYTRFRQGEHASPGQARCGDTHFPPNGAQDYDYANPRAVASSCAAYLDYPLLQRPPEVLTCDAWGCDQRQFMMWMFSHVPRNPGSTAGYHHNWWKYLIDYNGYLGGCGRYLDAEICRAGGCRWFDCAQCGALDARPDDLCGPAWDDPPPNCAGLGDPDACGAHADRCLWYDCARACHPHGTPLEQVCPPPEGPQDCTTLGTLNACDAHADSCAWYACTSQCLPRGTPVDQVCGEGPLPACSSYGTLEACDAEAERCAWYRCADECHPRGTPAEQVCPDQPPACTSLRTLEACDAEADRCAWYRCADECHPRGTPAEQLCPEQPPTCSSLRTLEACDAEADRCAWYRCANECHPRGTPAEQVCPDQPPACTSLRTLQACDGEADRCAWYLCVDECHPRGTPAEQVCPEQPPQCTSLRTLQACDAEADRCAWYLCADECHPRGTPAERVCPDHNPCAIYRDLETCDAHAAECAWYLCADECHPRGTPAEEVCAAP